MIVEFLNNNFNSVGDLGKVDKFIDDINLDKSKNQENIEAKLRSSNDDGNRYQDESNVVNELIQQVSQIINSHECQESEEAGGKFYDGLEQINLLISQYGDIEFLNKTKEALIERIELEKENDIFNSYNEVISDINNLLEYHLKESVIFETTENKDEQQQQDIVIHCYLNQLKKINEKINEFQEIEKDREEKKYFNNLIQKLSKIINQSEVNTISSIRSIFEKRLINSIKLIKINEITDINQINELKDTEELNKLRINFKDLIYLQSYDYLNKLNNYPNTLWSFDKLIEITFKFKFIYHFEDHNNIELNKFEIYLNFFKNYLNKNFKNFEIILNNNFIFKDTNYEGEIFLYNLIKSMLIPLKEKLFNSINLIINNDKELSNFAIELTEFDKYLIENFGFNPNYSFNNNNNTSGNDQWSGLIGDLILFNTKIFNKWLSNEKLFVSHRYDEIVNTNQNESEISINKDDDKYKSKSKNNKNNKLILQPFSIDFDIVKDGETKPTNSSINLKNLIENITKTFENLSLKFQLKIISEVQLKLLDFYFEKLVNGLDALNLYKIEEINLNDDGVTVKYLERILRIFNSSEYMIENMQKWNEEIVFIELWNSINDNNDNCFFTSVINNYNIKINEKIFKIINNYFEKLINNNFKFYYNMNQWTNENINEINNNEINFTIKLIKNELIFLKKSVNFKNYLNIKIRISKIILKFFNEKILKNFKINIINSNKLEKDLNYIIESIELPKLIEYKQFEQCIIVLTDKEKEKDVNQLKIKYKLDLIDDKLIKEMVLRRG